MNDSITFLEEESLGNEKKSLNKKKKSALKDKKNDFEEKLTWLKQKTKQCMYFLKELIPDDELLRKSLVTVLILFILHVLGSVYIFVGMKDNPDYNPKSEYDSSQYCYYYLYQENIVNSCDDYLPDSHIDISILRLQSGAIN